MVTSEEFAKKRGLEPLATIVSQAYVADDFAYLARTPAKAGAKALEKAGKTIDDVERVELNEAFSSVVLNSTKLLGADPEQVNVNGGAVALGHPIGASGARILGTMIYELRRNGGGLGLAAICSGGGQGDALLIEVLEKVRRLRVTRSGPTRTPRRTGRKPPAPVGAWEGAPRARGARHRPVGPRRAPARSRILLCGRGRPHAANRIYDCRGPVKAPSGRSARPRPKEARPDRRRRR